ncbi:MULTISPECIES: GTP-binding protein [Mycolicibacterium]|uniref:Cobalamin biosynthesis protein n=1 Tax=Mycolicibacterium fortuitum TaxID=1766 RepID=A0ABD6QD84_MYCFO|nr:MULTISPECIES: GTP-binding protein [Mycolicibacterium]NOQ61241.1 GTP-binding protein [Mycolicibacterium fortuitum]OBG48970.1 cobalamin biosynthesis protein [Mycolicibacterium fortuitum]OBK09691.1 cobalamin biosynthesis protein [Mycolicibacterium fortuitum]OMC06355.1 cobalamin biosynthesis protein [Mycolicibacterium fortuitum]OMC34435.1 cobalamin biosynthesis protein [Mycolicibacterium fortuitum]
MTSVPVLAVAGHLGAGKTTLLNHLLRNSRGVRIGALVNDFGAVNIDAMLVAGQVDAMASLSNGCICCAVDAEEAGEMLAKLAAVKPRLDLIVVEASGVAEPAALARTIVTADDPRFHYAGLVLVVDGLQPELGHGLRVADLVVLNKASSCADLDGLLARIRADSPRVPVLPTDFANIDPELLIDPPPPRAPQAQLSFDELLREEHDHDHPEYQSIEFSTDAEVNPRRFMEFLQDRPEGLYRAKGFVDFGAQRFLVQLVGSSLRFEKRGAGGTELVLIGTGMDRSAVLAGLQQCIGVPADENAMLGVLKYVV